MPRHHFLIKPARSGQAGFTLIEVLVVLIIVGMTSGVLFEALERAYRLQERFGIALFKAQQGQMAADWYRQTIEGLQPDDLDGAHVFKGKDNEFSGLTSNPLSGEYGAPTPVTWEVRNNRKDGRTELVYIEGKHETSVLSWGSKQARFIYLDEKLMPYSSWPPPLGLSTQIPKQIQLVTRDYGEPVSIIASPMGAITTPPRQLAAP